MLMDKCNTYWSARFPVILPPVETELAPRLLVFQQLHKNPPVCLCGERSRRCIQLSETKDL